VEGSPTPSVEDRAGNLWFGTDAHGVARLARDGFVSYDTTDGLDSMNAYGFAEEPGGPLHVITLANGHTLARFDAGHFTSVHPRAPGLLGWGQGQIATIDRDHRWWYPTGYGALRYPRVAALEDLATTEPKLYATLPGRDVLRMFADSRGDVWIATMSKTGLARWDRATDRTITLRDGWPTGLALSFAEDARGDVYIGYDDGHVVCVHDGQPHVLPIVVAGEIGAVLVDPSGRLWLASDEDGVTRIDDPMHPVAHHYRASDGIGSDQALALVEDRGRIYVGTTRGIARIDPSTDEIVHYGADDGLRNDYILAAFHSGDHSLWFGSKGGVSRLVPQDERPSPIVPVYITHLALAGRPLPLAAGGQRRIDSIELASDEGALDLEFASPQFTTGSRQRFQYRLDDTWSSPFAEHTLHFARLAAGHYDLEVRAIDARGVASPSTTIAFTVLPPVWRRWWFLAMALLAASLLGYFAYRRRLAQVLAIERVRTRIATDLHDELGSSLSRISILSEVASRRAAAREDIGGQISVIGTSARELVDVASDIVWSTDPRRDDLGSLLVRLRTFAADLFDARGIAWSITAPSEPATIKLRPDRRRHLYLVLKEAITNSARHSGATRVDVTIALAARGLTATVRDDGNGFEEDTLVRRGNGLTNMRSRAAEAGGTLDVRCDHGTEVTLRL
ncbi:MAG TPA: ATP-binding protein, partial [Kofleriaceae bacterium]